MSKIKQKSGAQRQFWPQLNALQMGSGWDEEDVKKPQIPLDDGCGDSLPGCVHLDRLDRPWRVPDIDRPGLFRKRPGTDFPLLEE
ncbi:MAG: hypothetical protein KJO60_15985 [Desulfofustis sp.]|nr:hypothetical protein [Desulfofustis sp.]